MGFYEWFIIVLAIPLFISIVIPFVILIDLFIHGYKRFIKKELEYKGISVTYLNKYFLIGFIFIPILQVIAQISIFITFASISFTLILFLFYKIYTLIFKRKFNRYFFANTFLYVNIIFSILGVIITSNS